MRSTLPALPGIFSFGVIAGVAMVGAGLSPVAAMAMSLMAYAGSAQLVALQMMIVGAPVAVIGLAALIVNLRFALYSLTVAPHMQHLSRRQRWLLSYLLSDTGFAIATARFATRPNDPTHYEFLMGICCVGWVAWEAGNALGILFGASLPASWGLEFVVVLTFLGFGISAVIDRATLAAFLAGGSVALFVWNWPLRLGLIVATVAGVAVGLLVERTGRRAAAAKT